MTMTFDEARHLVSRTGLGTPPQEIARLTKLTRSQAIKKLLGEVQANPTSKLPDWAMEPAAPREVMMAQMQLQDRKEMQKFIRQRALELKEWWFAEMLQTKSPLTERMTLFWHNHFTSSATKVRRPELLIRQNLMLRKQAFGSFKDLLGEVLRDPAMLVYLDNVRNNANTPNENLGRELLELFTLGEGNYSEQDVKAAARALTGRGVNRRDGSFRDAKFKHDGSDKTLLGETGAFDGDELVMLLVEHPACANFVVSKVRREFITTPATKSETAKLTAAFRKRWRIDDLLVALLESEEFWAESNRGTRIKSPVDLLVGTVRTLDLEIDRVGMLVLLSRSLGQDVFDPPNVKGWPGGEAWITSNSLLRRRTALNRAARLATRVEDLEAWLAGVPGGTDAERFERVLLAVAPVVAEREKGVRKHIRALLTDPAYQVG